MVDGAFHVFGGPPGSAAKLRIYDVRATGGLPAGSGLPIPCASDRVLDAFEIVIMCLSVCKNTRGLS